jgi:hypothetical protein
MAIACGSARFLGAGPIFDNWTQSRSNPICVYPSCKCATVRLSFATASLNMTNPNQIWLAAVWLYIVATTTLLNSLLLQLFLRFIDFLAGLGITQLIDAIFVGLRSVEPEGAPATFEILLALILDAVVVLIVVALAVKVSRRSRGAAAISFFVYMADTATFGFTFAASVWSHAKPMSIGWQALTLLVHITGTVILFRAWRTLRTRTLPAQAPSN